MTRTTTRRNLELVMTWLDAMRRKDLDDAVACFAPDAVWEGLVAEVECHDRDAVRDMLAENLDEQDLAVDGLELLAGAEHVVLAVRSRELQELVGVALNGQLFNVFTIRDDRIVHVRDFALWREALGAATVDDPGPWR